MGLTTHRHYRLFLYGGTFLIVLLGAVVAACGIFWMFPPGLGEGYHAVQASVRGVGKVLFWRIALLYAVLPLFCVPAIVVLHLLYSHRIAGPVFRLSKEAARIGRGDLTGSIKFRQKDNLMDMADLLNGVASQYRCRINDLRDYLSVIERDLQTASNLVRQGRTGDSLRQAGEAIAKNVKNIDDSLSEIKT
jgi:methyl-accepting chemotaxis protein